MLARPDIASDNGKCRKVIRKRTPIELLAAIYAAEGWVRKEGESKVRRAKTAYDITVDKRVGRYIATRKVCSK